ncbi:MAG: DUF6017 domain-containing protein [Lachnospiraceae bacterium]
MAVFRVERTRDYTVMSNCHLRDKRLSLKAKGLLSQMLSLPEDWDYTLAGLSSINRESKDAIRSAVNELERAGYIRRYQTTDAQGKFSGNEYIIYEHPVETENGEAESQKQVLPQKPLSGNPSSENPTTENPVTGKPLSDNPTQLNTKELRKEERNTDRENTDSFPSGKMGTADEPPDGKGKGYSSVDEIRDYRELIRRNIGYECLVNDYPYEQKMIDEIVELMVEVVCAKRQYTRVAGSDFPHEVVKARILKLDIEHIRFVISCLKENTTKVKNIKQYILTVLFNAPTTISNYYSSLVNHDMYGS